MMAKKPVKNKSEKTPESKFDIVNDERLMAMLAGFVEFRYEMNVVNAMLKPQWLRTIAHYTICISVLHSRMSRGSVRPKSEAVFVMQGRMAAGRINKVVGDLVRNGYLEERPLPTDKRKMGYWATDKLVLDAFKYLLTAWEINYHNDEVMGYFRGLTDDMQYLFDSPEGERIRAAYNLASFEEDDDNWARNAWGVPDE